MRKWFYFAFFFAFSCISNPDNNPHSQAYFHAPWALLIISILIHPICSFIAIFILISFKSIFLSATRSHGLITKLNWEQTSRPQLSVRKIHIILKMFSLNKQEHVLICMLLAATKKCKTTRATRWKHYQGGIFNMFAHNLNVIPHELKYFQHWFA